MTKATINRPIYLIISGLTLLVSGLMTLMNLSEWYKIAILDKADAYPFGGEGPIPYYYKTAELYTTVNLVWGLLFLLTLCVTTWTIIKGQKTKTIVSFGLTVLLFITMFIHGQIGAD